MKLIGYLPTGFPSLKRSMEIAELYIKGGCDGIEMSFPYANPIYEPTNVAAAMLYSLWKCDDYNQYLDTIREFKRSNTEASTISLVNTGTVREIGIEKYVQFYKDAKMECMVLPGNDPDLRTELLEKGVHVHSHIGWDLLESDIERAKATEGGLIYAPGVPIPGFEIHEGIHDLIDVINYIKNSGVKQPVYCGVGIRTPEDVKRLRDAGAGGVFLGSSLMFNFDNDERLLHVLDGFDKAAHE